MEQKKRIGKNLTDGPVFKTLIVFAIPMILASLLQQLYSAVDLMIIGQYVGSVGTVAVSTGGELTDFMTFVAMAVAMGAQVYISQLTGAGDEENMKRAVGTMFTILFGFSIVVAVIMVVFHDLLLSLLNCPEEAWEQSANYMMITAVGLPFVFGYNGIASTLRGMGESTRPMIFVAVAAFVNIFADYLLVVVIPLEAAGTAIATVLSQIGSFAAGFYYLYKHREVFEFELKLSYFKIDKNAFRRIMRMAIPQFIRTLSVQGSMLWVKSNVNTYGLIASSTYSVGNKIEKFMNVFVQGVDGAAGAMVGQNLGARKINRVYKVIWYTLAFNMVVAFFVVLIFLNFPSQLYSLFTTDEEVIEFGATFLRILSVGMFIVAFASCFKSMATGAGAAMLSLVIGVLDGVSRIVVCLIADKLLNQGVESYFWGAAFCMLLPGIICFVYFLSGKWKHKKLLSET